MLTHYDPTLPLTAPVVKILDASYCLAISTPVWSNEAIVLQITHAAVICVLAIIQFVRLSFQMYRATKQWHINQYMSLLVQQGILYFFAYVPIFLHLPYASLSDDGLGANGGFRLASFCSTS